MMPSHQPKSRPEYDRLLQRLTLPRALHPMHEELPTVQEGLAMFRGNPGLASVVTEQGQLLRNGTLTLPAWSTASDRNAP